MDPETSDTSRASSPEKDRTSLIVLSLVFCIVSVVATSSSKMAIVSVNCPLVVIGLGQLFATLFILLAINKTVFPALTRSELTRTLPFSIAYISSLFLALESIRSTDFAVYTVLQWLTLLFVAVGQALAFSRYESLHINAALAMIQLGTLLTAIHYHSTRLYADAAVIVLSNAVYACYLLYASKMLMNEKDPFKLLYCNMVVGICIVVLFAAATGELRAAYNYPHWAGPSFILVFSLSCTLGAITALVTLALLRITSPLTFAVVDGMKNLVVTYIGIFLASEYRVEIPLWRLYGIHVTVAGCLFYVYYRMWYSESPHTHVVKVSPIVVDV